MASNARWTLSATDLSATPKEAGRYLAVGEVSDATGLAQATILDAITRNISNADNPLIALASPAVIFNKGPLWSTEQVDQYNAQQKAKTAGKALTSALLPRISPEEAQQRGLVSLRELAERSQQHEQTVRRWVKDQRFPQAVARRKQEGEPGQPEHVYPQVDALTWIAQRLADSRRKSA